MIEKTKIVESLLTEMFYYEQEMEKAMQELELIFHEMKGLKSPNLTGIHGTPEDRQHKLIRLGEKASGFESKRDAYKIQYMNIFQKLRLYQLEEWDMDFIEMLYKNRMTCEEVARKYGYSNRKYVSRKRIKLIEKISKTI